MRLRLNNQINVQELIKRSLEPTTRLQFSRRNDKLQTNYLTMLYRPESRLIKPSFAVVVKETFNELDDQPLTTTT